MEKGFRALLLTYLLTASAVFALDLLTKELAERLFKEPVRVLPFLYFELIYNKGVAFGFFSELPDSLRKPLLLLPPLLGAPFTFFMALKERSLLRAFAWGLVGGGALGNLYDRLLLGKVRDFIHLHAGAYHWPAFNLADASITLGVFLLTFDYFFREKSRKDLPDGSR